MNAIDRINFLFDSDRLFTWLGYSLSNIKTSPIEICYAKNPTDAYASGFDRKSIIWHPKDPGGENLKNQLTSALESVGETKAQNICNNIVAYHKQYYLDDHHFSDINKGGVKRLFRLHRFLDQIIKPNTPGVPPEEIIRKEDRYDPGEPQLPSPGAVEEDSTVKGELVPEIIPWTNLDPNRWLDWLILRVNLVCLKKNVKIRAIVHAFDSAPYQPGARTVYEVELDKWINKHKNPDGLLIWLNAQLQRDSVPHPQRRVGLYQNVIAGWYPPGAVRLPKKTQNYLIALWMLETAFEGREIQSFFYYLDTVKRKESKYRSRLKNADKKQINLEIGKAEKEELARMTKDSGLPRNSFAEQMIREYSAILKQRKQR